MTLEDLHEAIQAVMGWEDEHLWSFSSGGRDGIIYEIPHKDDFAAFGRRLRMDATKTTLRKVFPKRGAKLTYEYDFGDSWDHVITRLADPKVPEIACLKSEGPDGLEDFGGQWRSAESLKAPKMSDEEQAHLLGVLFATTVSQGMWEIIEDALKNGGTCEFIDDDKSIGAYFLDFFDGLKVKDGVATPFCTNPSKLTVHKAWVDWYAAHHEEWSGLTRLLELLEEELDRPPRLREVGERLREVPEQFPVQLFGEGGVALVVRVADKPQLAVINGVAQILPELDFLQWQ